MANKKQMAANKHFMMYYGFDVSLVSTNKARGWGMLMKGRAKEKKLDEGGINSLYV